MNDLQRAIATIERLIQQRSDLTDDRDAALAQNAELARLLRAAEQQTAQLTLIALGDISLRDIQAEAGRAGFVAGYGKCWRESYGTKPNTDSVDEYADSYADRVKDGYK